MLMEPVYHPQGTPLSGGLAIHKQVLLTDTHFIIAVFVQELNL